jgi:tRNA threonylcarbamoyladenosine biosynthesis protein TsaE
MIIDLPDLTATQELGRCLGRVLFPGAVIALVGPLGAGKTHLVRAIAEGLDIPDSRLVTSPTFILIQEYPARLPIYHLDAYRLGGVRDLEEIGVQEYLEGDGVCLIEWADRAPACLPMDRLTITLAVTGETSRQARLEARGNRYEQLLADAGLGS